MQSMGGEAVSDPKNSTTKKILRTHERVMRWSWLLADLLLAALLAGGLCLWHVRSYLGTLERLPAMMRLIPRFYEDPFQVVLDMEAIAMKRVSVDVTESFMLMVIVFVTYLVVRILVQAVMSAIWHRQVRRHMGQISQLAQEARRLGAEEARRNFRVPKVDALEEAIDHISPTEATRLHTGDPDLQGLETAVNDLLDRMQAAYSQQSRFVSDASHELRTPIAVLKGYADLLERWGKHDPQVRDEAILAIQQEAERMNRLVEQLLFLARGDSGRIPLQLCPLDLAELMKEVWEESRMIDPDHEWVLDAPQPVTYTGDRDMLKQAMRILSDNAAKYTPAGKTITLRAFSDTAGKAYLVVRDEGMGIKSEDAAHVFDRFYRSDPARSRQSGGAGLGLAIADWIVARHGGHVEVYSWEGVGSRFTIVL